MSGLPSGWVMRRLGDVAETRLGKMLDKGKATGAPTMSYLRNANVQWGRIDTSDLLQIEIPGDERERFSLRRGDLLVCEGGEIGRCAVWTGPDDVMAYQKALHRVRGGPDVDVRYLRYLLDLYSRDGTLRRHATGSTIAHLPQEVLRRLPVPLPLLKEQRRIVDLLEDHLSRLDAADSSLGDADRRLIAYRQQSLEQAVSRPDAEWVSLGSLIERVEAGKSFGGSAPPAQEGEWGVIKVSAMTWGEFRPDENKAVPAERANPRYEIASGDVLVSRANTTAYVGAPVLVRTTPQRRLLSDKSLRLVPRPDVKREWLVAVLSAPSTRRQISAVATGTSDSMRNVSQSNLLAVRVPLVSLAEQEAIVLPHTRVQEATVRLSKGLHLGRKRSTALRRALLDAAFSGRLLGRSTDTEIVEEIAEQQANDLARARGVRTGNEMLAEESTAAGRRARQGPARLRTSVPSGR